MWKDAERWVWTNHLGDAMELGLSPTKQACQYSLHEDLASQVINQK